MEDVNTTINFGEMVALSGSNGSGKSTLMPIANITSPSRGRISVHGSVVPLIELGAGFHPDLSGYENIFVNGVLLGMRTHEVKSKLSAIVEFSGIEEFLSMPVKHYSNGMYLRLAFSIAVHSDSDIYLVDEVLTVGDIQFQNSCFAKFEELNAQGKTIVFVTHDLYALKRLAKRIVYIEAKRTDC